MAKKNELQNINIPLLVSVILIVFIGILMIYSTGFDPIDKLNNGLYKKQMVWFGIGFVLMMTVAFVNYRLLGDYSLYIYIGLLFILVLTTIFGTPVRSARAWINFGFFSIQPSEFMKLGYIILIAKFLEIRERDIQNFRELMIPSLITIIPVFIIYMQPDFGTAMIFIPIFFTMLFLGGADVSQIGSIISIAAIGLILPMILTYTEWVGQGNEVINPVIAFFKGSDLLFIIAGALLVVAIVAFVLHFFFIKKIYRKIYIPSMVFSMGLFLSVFIQHFLKDYQKKRILVFLNPTLDPHGSGYNVIQSKIAIGSGGFFGKGFLHGTQSQLGFLPEKTTDFIFSVVAEEWGLLGSIVLLGLFAIVIFKGIQIAFEAGDKFGTLLASGITTMFFFHMVINIGMTLGVMPVTGLPLTFVSYGGSNLVVSLIAVGILLNIHMKKKLR
ncbi:MAG: rod shape-determining protein RodA [Spirochaetota bacterium]